MQLPIKEYIKSLKREDFETNKVNLHIHTSFSDGEGDVFDLLRQAKEKGFHKIAISDHNTVEAHKLVKDEILIPAVEFDVWCGYVFMHLLAYGIDINNEELSSFYAKNKRETELDCKNFCKTRYKKINSGYT